MKAARDEPDPAGPGLDEAIEGGAEPAHRVLNDGEFWRRIPAWSGVDAETFLDHRWQQKNSLTRPDQLRALLQGAAPEGLFVDVEHGLGPAPMSLRISPYVLALIDWRDPYADPVRRQFLPVGSALEPDHPALRLDSLHEQHDAKVEGLVHRYPDKALFLTLDTCPVYCRFCTRSYAVGLETLGVPKLQLRVNAERWARALEYVAAHPTLEDIVLSGGDCYSLRPEQLSFLGHALLDIPHVRRIRLATKGLAVLPMKILSDEPWVAALVGIVDRARESDREAVVHTHFNHPREVTEITQRAMRRLHRAGVRVRNQSVLLRGVNDDPEVQRLLVRRLSYVNVQPYYVYQHDMVRGVEDLRTSVGATAELEKQVRGATAGFNTPTFVVDLPGGGGKRDVHSHEHYDPVTGISVYRSPNVDAGAHYLYFDPLSVLPDEGRARWGRGRLEQRRMIAEARAACR